jgi:threonine/homoserine/homoserine lactone efflux protein
MVPYFIQGLTLGLAAAAQPGPFQAYLLTQVFSMGWRRTLPAAFAPLVSDGPIIIFVLVVLNQVPDWFQRMLSAAGGIFILFLASQALRAWARMRQDAGTPLSINLQSSYTNLWRAALMNALAPGPYLFWSLAAGPIFLRGWREQFSFGFTFLFGFYAAMVLSLFAIIIVFGTAERSGARFRRGLLGVSGLALSGFGLYQLGIGFFGW